MEIVAKAPPDEEMESMNKGHGNEPETAKSGPQLPFLSVSRLAVVEFSERNAIYFAGSTQGRFSILTMAAPVNPGTPSQPGPSREQKSIIRASGPRKRSRSLTARVRVSRGEHRALHHGAM